MQGTLCIAKINTTQDLVFFKPFAFQGDSLAKKKRTSVCDDVRFEGLATPPGRDPENVLCSC